MTTSVAIEGQLNRIQQILVVEGLGKELYCTGFDGLCRHWNITMAGNEDDGNAHSSVCQLPLKRRSAMTSRILLSEACHSSIATC
jgi:hypothetical protein